MIEKAVIDFSAFIGKDKEVVIKELTVMDVASKNVFHWLFKPPKDASNGSSWCHDRRNCWLSAHYHGLDFYSGFNEYESMFSLLSTICMEVKLLFAADTQKAKVLENLFGSPRRLVFSLELLGCPPLPKDELYPNCKVYGVVDDGGPTPETETLESRVSEKCLFHRLFADSFVCSLSNARFLADWCANNLDLLDMNKADVREKTFRNWPVESPNVQTLAALGFVQFPGSKDNVKCVYCGMALHKWEEGDDAREDHYYNSPFCKFLCYLMQQERAKNIADAKSTKSKGRGGQAAEDTQAPFDEFYNRYGTPEDISEEEIFSMCKV